MNARAVAATALLRGLGASWKIEMTGVEHLDAARRQSPRGNVIFAFWHSSLLMLAYTHRRRDIQVLVTQHRDGEWIAGTLARLGSGLVRGSSRRGGVEALFRLATALDRGLDVAVTVDGPIGPRYTVHPGVALLARRTGRPIVLLVPTYARGWRLTTWDELRVPALGTRVRVAHEPALWVPAAGGTGAVGSMQERLGAVLRDATRREESAHGRSIDLVDIQDRRSLWERWSERPSPPAPLRALSHAYGLGVQCERAIRKRPAGAAGRPWVIGIGNLEAGGTGKTPCVALVAAALAATGLEVAVLTRGHRGGLGRAPEYVDADTLARAADETRWLVATLGRRVPVLVSRDKAAGLERLRRRQALDVVVVDDAFQTPRLGVDRHIVLLDWERPFGNGWLLPAGRLREPPAALARADALLFTRARAATPPRAFDTSVTPCFVAREEDGDVQTATGAPFDAESLRGAGVALLCGLGRPQAFERLAAAAAARRGFAIRRSVRVGDHARLEPELRRLAGRLEPLGCRSILTTAKDVARLPPDHEWNEPLLVLEQRLVVPDLGALLECATGQFSSRKSEKITDIEA